MSNEEDWTLEWVLFKSSVLSELFKESIKEVHSGTSEFQTNEDFADKLTEKLKNKSLKKVEIASIFAHKLEESSIDLVEDENIKYLLDAIKYASEKEIRTPNPE
jgi:putative ATP-dependent endonuclease of OLD family